MVAAVARAAVAVLPAVVGGEQYVEGGQEVVVAARAGFEDGDTGGRVRYEDVEQAVAGGGRPGEELFAVVRQVGDGLLAPVVMCRTLVVKVRGMAPSSRSCREIARPRAETPLTVSVLDRYVQRHVPFSSAHFARSHRPAAGGFRRVALRLLTSSQRICLR